jgi:hypothetical protein
MVLWLRLPWTRDAATDLLLSVTNNVITACVIATPPVNLTGMNTPSAEETNLLFRMIVRMGLASDEKVEKLRELLRSGFVLVGGIFFLSSGKATQLGCLLVGHLFPTYYTLAALSTNSKASQWKWAAYWTCGPAFTFVHTSLPWLCYVPLWSHVRLAVYYWLQLPVAHGADRLLARIPPVFTLTLEDFGFRGGITPRVKPKSPPPSGAGGPTRGGTKDTVEGDAERFNREPLEQLPGVQDGGPRRRLVRKPTEEKE